MTDSFSDNGFVYDPRLTSDITYSTGTNVLLHKDTFGNNIIPGKLDTVSNGDNTFIEDNNNMYASIDLLPTPEEANTLGWTTFPNAGSKQQVSYLHVKDELFNAGLITNRNRQWNNRDQAAYFTWATGLNLFTPGNMDSDIIQKNYGFAYSQEMPIAIANTVAIYSVVAFMETATPRTKVDDLIYVSFIVYEINNNADVLLFNKNYAAETLNVPSGVEFTVPFTVGDYTLTVVPILNSVIRTATELKISVVDPIVNDYYILPIWKFSNVFTDQIITGIIIERNGKATSLLWDFGDGSPKLKTNNDSKEFVYRYKKPGLYTISVEATVNGLFKPEAKVEMDIQVEANNGAFNLVPTWDFLGIVNEPTYGLGHTINGNPDCVLLDFGDGSPVQTIVNHKAEDVYSHVYTQTGIYAVSMIAIVKGLAYPKEVAYPYTVITDSIKPPTPYSLTCEWQPLTLTVGSTIFGTVVEYGGLAQILNIDYGDGLPASLITNFYGTDSKLNHAYNKAGSYRISIEPIINGVSQTMVISDLIMVIESRIVPDPKPIPDPKPVPIPDPIPDPIDMEVYNSICTWSPNPVTVTHEITGVLDNDLLEKYNLDIVDSFYVNYGDHSNPEVVPITIITGLDVKLSHTYIATGRFNITLTPRIQGLNQEPIISYITVINTPVPIPEPLPYSVVPMFDTYATVVGSLITGTVKETNGIASSFIWNFQDGTPPIMLAAGVPATHIYSSPNSYRCTVTPTVNGKQLAPVNCEQIIIISPNLGYALTVAWLTRYVQLGQPSTALITESNGKASSFYLSYDDDVKDGVNMAPFTAMGNRFTNYLNIVGDRVLNLIAYDKVKNDKSKAVIGKASTGIITVVNNLPTKNINYEAYLVVPNLKSLINYPVSFNIGEVVGSASRFIWNFGDNSTQTVLGSTYISHTYTNLGKYRISVTPVVNNVNQDEIINVDLVEVVATVEEANVEPIYTYINPDEAGKEAGDAAYAEVMATIISPLSSPNYAAGQKQANLAANSANATAKAEAKQSNLDHGFGGG